MPHVLIIGGGFAGLNAAKGLGNVADIQVTLVDKTNHHLFQPLLYQVAMAGLSPANIAAPIRSLLRHDRNIRVVQGEVKSLDLNRNVAVADFAEISFDYLIVACGSRHSYFGHDEWEEYAPGLKTLEQATEIRRRVLSAFEEAERCDSPQERTRYLTFAIVGGGPTGVELAGAIGEMSRFTLARDFRNVDATQSRVILLEAGPRILPSFSPELAARAVRDLEHLGVHVWVNSAVTNIDADGIEIGKERIHAATVLWAAGVQADTLGAKAGVKVDRQGRVLVEPDLSVPGHKNVFVAGDQACFLHQTGKPLPGTAPVAMQQGRYLARTIRDDLAGKPRKPFHFVDKGQMATIGRSRAVAEMGRLKLGGFAAWVLWLVVHIYYLTGFRNRLLV
ncbi:MAG: NAD(P)/FAD-dependent oxidoreductase, partial [Pirellulales bacterium]